MAFGNDMHLRTLIGEDFAYFNIGYDNTFLIYSEKEWKKFTSQLESVQM